MLDISLPLNNLIELLVDLLLVPGNYLVRTVAFAISEVFSMHADQPAFIEGGLLAIFLSIFFWLVLMIETFMIYRYTSVAYEQISITCHKLRRHIEQRVRRIRIVRACEEAMATPSVEDESTIVYELTELDDLAMNALRIARDRNPADGVAVQELRQSSGAGKKAIRQALQQLEQLQFVSRDEGNASSGGNYRLTATGHMYLKACEG